MKKHKDDIKTKWFKAVRKLSYVRVKDYLNTYPYLINATDYNFIEYNALMFLITSNKQTNKYYNKIFDLLLYHPGLDINKKTLIGNDALYLAFNYLTDEYIIKIIKHPNVNLTSNNNGEALIRISHTNHIFLDYEIQKYIFQKEPSLIKSYIKYNIQIDPYIKEELAHLFSAFELNLF